MNHGNRQGRWIDAHLHADLYEAGERGTLLEQAFHCDGIAAVVAVSMHVSSCETNYELSKRYPGRVHPAYGYHPEQALPSDA